MSKDNNRNNYSREFKLEAIKMSEQVNKTVAEVARELGLRENDLHNWRKMAKVQGDQVFPGPGRKPKDDLSQLKRENARLREENEILKKATIFFAKEVDKSTSL
jgi:transposase